MFRHLCLHTIIVNTYWISFGIQFIGCDRVMQVVYDASHYVLPEPMTKFQLSFYNSVTVLKLLCFSSLSDWRRDWNLIIF